MLVSDWPLMGDVAQRFSGSNVSLVAHSKWQMSSPSSLQCGKCSLGVVRVAFSKCGPQCKQREEKRVVLAHQNLLLSLVQVDLNQPNIHPLDNSNDVSHIHSFPYFFTVQARFLGVHPSLVTTHGIVISNPHTCLS